MTLDWQLTGVTHSKAYGDGRSICEGYLNKDGTVFIRRHGWFGNCPETLGMEDARAMSLILVAIIAEHDEYQAALTREYGAPRQPHPTQSDECQP